MDCRDKVVDFHWNASDPWTIVSVSDDCESTGGGGTLQVILKIPQNQFNLCSKRGEEKGSWIRKEMSYLKRDGKFLVCDDPKKKKNRLV